MSAADLGPGQSRSSDARGGARGRAKAVFLTPADRSLYGLLPVLAERVNAEVRVHAPKASATGVAFLAEAHSLQWYQDSTRYLRHMAYQVFATPISDSTQQNDASFVIERE